jgi:hypothetical protein
VRQPPVIVHAGKPAGGDDQVGLGQAGQAGRFARRELAHPLAQGIEAAGVRGDPGVVGPALPEHQVQQAVAQRHVAAGQQLQVQIRCGRGLGPARIDDDEPLLRIRAPGVFEPAEQHWVGPGHVAAADVDRVGPGDVVVAGRRRIRTQRGLVSGNGTAHAQPRVGVDVVGAQQSLGELVEDVVVLGQQLAADVQANGIRPVLGMHLGQALGHARQRLVPPGALPGSATLGPTHRVQCAGGLHQLRLGRQVQGLAFAAQAAEVRRVRRVALHADDGVAAAFDHDAAADPAIRAGGSRLAEFGHGRVRVQPSVASSMRSRCTASPSTRTANAVVQP